MRCKDDAPSCTHDIGQDVPQKSTCTWVHTASGFVLHNRNMYKTIRAFSFFCNHTVKRTHMDSGPLPQNVLCETKLCRHVVSPVLFSSAADGWSIRHDCTVSRYHILHRITVSHSTAWYSGHERRCYTIVHWLMYQS